MYIDVKTFNKEELLNYINKFLYKDSFKMNADSIGKCIIKEMQICEKELVPMLGFIMESVSGKAPIIWGAFRLDWYDRELDPENTFKTKLVPIGEFWSKMPEHKWYNSDFESDFYRGKALIVEDPIEAVEIANKLNEFEISNLISQIGPND